MIQRPFLLLAVCCLCGLTLAGVLVTQLPQGSSETPTRATKLALDPGPAPPLNLVFTESPQSQKVRPAVVRHPQPLSSNQLAAKLREAEESADDKHVSRESDREASPADSARDQNAVRPVVYQQLSDTPTFSSNGAPPASPPVVPAVPPAYGSATEPQQLTGPLAPPVPAAPAPSDAAPTNPNGAVPPGAPGAQGVPSPLPTAEPVPGGPEEVPSPVNDSSRPSKHEITRIEGEGDDKLAVHIQETDLREVLDMLSEQGGINIVASNNVRGKVSASLTGVDVDTALNAILKSSGMVARREGNFIYVGTATDFVNMEQNVDHLGTRVYRPNYIKASELQALILPLLTKGSGVASVSPPSAVGIANNANDAGGDTFAGSETVIVRDFEAVLAQIDQIMEEVDKRPLQVSIEAMILSVRLNDQNTFGVDFDLLRNQNHLRMADGSPLQDLGKVDVTSGGLKFGFLDSSLGAFLNALETIGDTNVVARPQVTCLNKHKAEILIGAQLGYVSSTTVNLTASTQQISFLEVGTQLRLRPFISTDGLIRMEIHPESSTGSVRVEQGLTLPDKEVTQVTTNVMVHDGGTIVIGGLTREDLASTNSQIPLLGSAPGIGFLFRHKKETLERRELIVLITPRIIYDPAACAEANHLRCEYERREQVLVENMSPINRRALGRRYLGLAQESLSNGNEQAALRRVNISIHFDPTNRQAIELRSQLSGEGVCTPDGTPIESCPVPTGEGLDGQQLPDWLVNGLEGAPITAAPPIHPRDPGVTGAVRPIPKPGAVR